MAGTIASSSGSASVTPIPCRNVRRGNERLLISITTLLTSRSTSRPSGCRLGSGGCSHLERHAADDAEHDGGEAIVAPAGVAHNRADGRHIVVLEAAPERIRQHLLGH